MSKNHDCSRLFTVAVGVTLLTAMSSSAPVIAQTPVTQPQDIAGGGGGNTP